MGSGMPQDTGDGSLSPRPTRRAASIASKLLQMPGADGCGAAAPAFPERFWGGLVDAGGQSQPGPLRAPSAAPSLPARPQALRLSLQHPGAEGSPAAALLNQLLSACRTKQQGNGWERQQRMRAVNLG